MTLIGSLAPKRNFESQDVFLSSQIASLPPDVMRELKELKPPVHPKGAEILAEFQEQFEIQPDQAGQMRQKLSNVAINALLDMDLANYPKYIVALGSLLVAFGVPNEAFNGTKVGERLLRMTKHIIPVENQTIVKQVS